MRNLSFLSELITPVNYKGLDLDCELRCDFLIEDALVVELKAIDAFAPVHEAQILTYMKILNKPKGILINFNCAIYLRKDRRLMLMNCLEIYLKSEVFLNHIDK